MVEVGCSVSSVKVQTGMWTVNLHLMWLNEQQDGDNTKMAFI